jgi:thiamine-phosphate pyrophosphorylase
VTAPYLHYFYPIVPDAVWVERLVKAGARCVQLRIKDASPQDMLEQIKTSLQAVKGTSTQLIINDAWEAAIEAGAKHIHLGQEDIQEADISAIRRAGLTLGLSTHDEAELDIALSYQPDYIAIGPIYFTTLKAMNFAPQGLEKISVWKQRIGDIPLVAVGGITLERAPAVFEAGADVIAVVSDITQNPDPEGRVQEWLDLQPF